MLRKLSIISLALAISMLVGCGSDISGTITYEWAPLGGVTVLLTGTPFETTTTTNGNGVYAFFELVPGGYTVTPSSSSYAFDPASQFVQIAAAGTSAINIDFEVSEVLVCFDDDGDGYGYPAHDSCDHPEFDCDDSDGNSYPGACEILDDGIDQDCDGRDALSSDPFTDNCDGTVTDNVSGLIWLQNAGAFGQATWDNAKATAAALDEGDFTWLTDGSSAGEWRLPTKEEWEAFPTYDSDMFYGLYDDSNYWSSTEYDYYLAWHTHSPTWGMGAMGKAYNAHIWPVR